MKSISPQLERRRALRRQRRQQLLIHTWRTVALLSLSTALGWLLLRYGWSLNGPHQVVVLGDTAISPELLADMSKLRFPQPLLAINPTNLERTLRDKFPVQSVQVSRRLLPTRLEVTLVDLTPVARAFRQQEGGLEAGFVDREGQWIRIIPATPIARPSTAISIRGWTQERRSLVASLLQQQDRLISKLLAITLHSDGAVSLRHQTLGRIDLGDDEQLLRQQMDVIVELDQSLPSHLLQEKGVVIDLSNPDRPEIQLPVKPATMATDG
ncbi:MAG: FtsQ-type POTRA domain-containing protein [Cyanobacteriota bacterium]|nr:FtsQ-type POTRA domain-containing protein [Cyanobacteriota bacterium]